MVVVVMGVYVFGEESVGGEESMGLGWAVVSRAGE